MRSFIIAVTFTILLSACATQAQKAYEGEALPESQTAVLKATSHHGIIFSERTLILDYLDGKKLGFSGYYRVLPGRHTLGIIAHWGNFCFPAYIGSGCLNYCYNVVELMAEAAHIYRYDIEKQQDEVRVLVSDNSGAIVARAKDRCEPFSHLGGSLDSEVIDSINERVKKESQ